MKIHILFIMIILVLSGCTKDLTVPEGGSNRIVLYTGEAYNITKASAIIRIEITTPMPGSQPAVTSKGVCLSLQPHPVTSNLSAYSPGIGAFTVTYNSLLPGNTYYARSYVVIASSVAIYGNEITFKTSN